MADVENAHQGIPSQPWTHKGLNHDQPVLAMYRMDWPLKFLL